MLQNQPAIFARQLPHNCARLRKLKTSVNYSTKSVLKNKDFCMSKKRFKESEIQRILQEYKDGTPIQQIIENYGISQATFYNWKAKYSRPTMADIQAVNKLKEDHDRLKRMFADLSMENLLLKAQLKNKEHQ